MKDFIASYLIDVVNDDYAETGLASHQLLDATEYIYQQYDCSDMYYQVDRLLHEYLAKK